jgi:hypothetical protein
MLNIMHKILFKPTISVKLYNNQRNAQVFFIYLSISSLLGMVSELGQTPYPGDLNHSQICTPASEGGVKESPKHVRQSK